MKTLLRLQTIIFVVIYFVAFTGGVVNKAQATVMPPITATCSGTNISCNGGNNGSMCVTVTGGTAPYSYQWSNGASTSCIQNLTAGTYCVTVTDGNGSSASCCYVVTQPPAISISSKSNTPVCEGFSVNLSSSATGGTGAYTYIWSGPGSYTSTNANPTIASATSGNGGVYSVTVTDAHGCKASSSSAVTITICNHLTMSLQNCSQTSPTTLQFDLYVVSDGSPSSNLAPIAFQFGVNFNTACLPSGAFMAPSFVNGTSDFIPPLNTFSFPASTNGHIRIVEAVYGGGCPSTMVIGHQYRVGTFRLTSSANWVCNCNPNFSLQDTASPGKTVCAAVVCINNSGPTTLLTRSLAVSCSLALNPCVGIEELTEESQIKIYPNPSGGSFTVSLSNMHNAMLRIFNVLGEEVYSEDLTVSLVGDRAGREIKLDAIAGIYFVHITEGERQYLRKLLIE